MYGNSWASLIYNGERVGVDIVDDVLTIQKDDVEIVLDRDQIDFLMGCLEKVKDWENGV